MGPTGKLLSGCFHKGTAHFVPSLSLVLPYFLWPDEQFHGRPSSQRLSSSWENWLVDGRESRRREEGDGSRFFTHIRLVEGNQSPILHCTKCELTNGHNVCSGENEIRRWRSFYPVCRGDREYRIPSRNNRASSQRHWERSQCDRWDPIERKHEPKEIKDQYSDFEMSTQFHENGTYRNSSLALLFNHL